MSILDTLLGRAALALVLVCAAFGAGWLRGHNRGWDAATSHYTAVVGAAMAANAKQAAAIDQLRSANAAYAQAAQVSAAQQERAEAAMAAQSAADAAALRRANERLDHVIRGDHAVAAWAHEPVPDAVARVLRGDAGH